MQLDYVLNSARRHGIRLILPFCDNWDYYVGGAGQFARWRGTTDFFGNSDCKADYKAYVALLVNRKNSLTGMVYRDDPTILCWESGNELASPLAWDAEMAAYLKSIDRNHLYLLGRDRFPHGSNGLSARQWLAIPEIDIYQRHYYAVHGLPWTATKDAAEIAGAGKVFLIGEFGWDKRNFTLQQLRSALREVESTPAVCGDLFWRVRGRKDNGDFMAVPGAGGEWWALYYPGRATGASNTEADMRARVGILSDHAAVMKKTR